MRPCERLCVHGPDPWRSFELQTLEEAPHRLAAEARAVVIAVALTVVGGVVGVVCTVQRGVERLAAGVGAARRWRERQRLASVADASPRPDIGRPADFPGGHDRVPSTVSDPACGLLLAIGL